MPINIKVNPFLEITRLWNLVDEPKFYRNVANDIYFSKNTDLVDVVIRITPASQRCRDELVSELHWIDFLFNSGLKTCRALSSVNGLFVEPLMFNNKSVYVVVFEKIPGERIELAAFNDTFIQKWAEALAQLHGLARQYQPPSHIQKRNDWLNDSIFHKSIEALNESSLAMRSLFPELIERLKKYPQTHENFGLVHGDLHTGNFFYINEEMHIFDFDDSAYHWFFYDLAIPLHTLVHHYSNREELKLRLNQFINFYFKDSVRPENWKEDFALFYRFRCTLVHFWLLAIRKERNLDEAMTRSFQESIEREAEQALTLNLLDILE